MNNKTSLLAVGILALALVVPAVQAQSVAVGIQNPTTSTPTTLYFHINGFQDFPINTQAPDDGWAANEGVGLATHSTSCVPNNGVTDSLTNHKYHTLYGFSSPSYVEYNFTEDGKPRIHQERGLSYDINVDQSAPFQLKWYLSTQTGAPGQPNANPNQVPLIVPQVVVRATMRTGEKISVGEEGYNSGQIIAQGQSLEALLGGSAATTQNANYSQVDSLNVYEISVPMTFAGQPTIAKDQGFSLRVDVFEKLPGDAACGNPDTGYVMPNVVKTHTSSGHRPRMVLSVLDPIRIEYMHPQFVGDDLVIHTSENSPWGNYDVDETGGGIELKVTGPSEARGLYRAAVVQRFHEHDHHTQAVDVTFVWPFKTDHGSDGTYTITLDVRNDQGTATAHGVAQFTIAKGGTDLQVTKCGGIIDTNKAAGASGQDCITEKQDTNGNAITVEPKTSPGVELLGLVSVLGAMAVVVRRRET